jgi:hypothetical protein
MLEDKVHLEESAAGRGQSTHKAWSMSSHGTTLEVLQKQEVWKQESMEGKASEAGRGQNTWSLRASLHALVMGHH